MRAGLGLDAPLPRAFNHRDTEAQRRKRGGMASSLVAIGYPLELVLSISAEIGRARIHFRPEITEDDERFDFAGVLERDAGLGGGFGAENFVAGEFVETN